MPTHRWRGLSRHTAARTSNTTTSPGTPGQTSQDPPNVHPRLKAPGGSGRTTIVIALAVGRFLRAMHHPNTARITHTSSRRAGYPRAVWSVVARWRLVRGPGRQRALDYSELRHRVVVLTQTTSVADAVEVWPGVRRAAVHAQCSLLHDRRRLAGSGHSSCPRPSRCPVSWLTIVVPVRRQRCTVVRYGVHPAGDIEDDAIADPATGVAIGRRPTDRVTGLRRDQHQREVGVLPRPDLLEPLQPV